MTDTIHYLSSFPTALKVNVSFLPSRPNMAVTKEAAKKWLAHAKATGEHLLLSTSAWAKKGYRYRAAVLPSGEVVATERQSWWCNASGEWEACNHSLGKLQAWLVSGSQTYGIGTSDGYVFDGSLLRKGEVIEA